MTSRLERGVGAVNQDFRRYEQVEKLQRYRLSEGAEEVFDEDYEFSPCDLSMLRSDDPAERARFTQQLGVSLEEIGFAILVNGPVSLGRYRAAHEKTEEFFTSHDEEVKMRFRAHRHGSVNQGYFPMKETTIIHPDLVEGWVFCRRAFDLDARNDYRESDFWPSLGYEPFFREIVVDHETLILPLMQSILRYLGEDPYLYDRKLTRTNFGFRLNYYPGLKEEAPAGGEDAGGRMLGHEDVDLFTIIAAPVVEGLQALHRGTMKWVRVQAPEGSIIINTGDYMQRITNNRLPSTTHRVARPRSSSERSRPRTTFPMAVYVWEDEILEVLPNQGAPLYEPVRAEDFHTRITSKYYGDDYHEKGTEG